MMKGYRYLGILVLLLCSGMAWSQNAAEVLYRAGNFFRNQSTYRMNLSYQLYKSHDATDVVEHYQGMTLKKEGNHYSKVKNTEMVVTDDWGVTISNEERLIVLQTGADRPVTGKELDLDLIKEYGEKLYMTREGNEFHVTIIFNEKAGASLEKMMVRVDTNTWFINGVTYYYGYVHDFSTVYNKQEMSTPRLEVLFFDYTDTVTIEKDWFEASRYFKKVKGTYVSGSKYNNYEIILN